MEETSSSLKVTASTSWVGAIAQAAGADQVTVLAPLDLKHPAEYDFRPNDVITAAESDVILWGGYEGFIKNLTAAAQIPESSVIQVMTNNAPPTLLSTTEKLANRFNTQNRYAVWKAELENISAIITTKAIEAQLSRKKAAVQFHQKPLATWLGYDIVAVFGPGELTMTVLQEIDALSPDIIIDNWHSPQGAPLITPEREYIQLVNFPGPFNTVTIMDVLRYNFSQLGLL